MTRRSRMIATAALATAAISITSTPAHAAPAANTTTVHAAKAAAPTVTTGSLASAGFVIGAPTTTGALKAESNRSMPDWSFLWDLITKIWKWLLDLLIGDKDPGNPVDPKPTPTPTATSTPTANPTTGKPTPTVKPTPIITDTTSPTPQPTVTLDPKPTSTATPTATTTPTATPTSTPTPSNPGGSNPQQQRVLELVNEERAKGGLSPLVMDACLRDRAAQEWSEQMAREQRMYHQPMSEVSRKCPGSPYVGENVAMGYRDPEAVMRGWMNSSGHRANIMNGNYKKLGVGVAKGSDGRLYWTQNFSR